MGDLDLTSALAKHINLVNLALLVAGRKVSPAEGLPYNPVYFHLLRVLGGQGPQRPSHLAEGLGVPRTSLSATVKAMKGKVLITSEPDPEDGRAMVLLLTEAGRSALDAIEAQDMQNAEAILACLEPGERAPFVEALGKVGAGLSGAVQ